MPKTSSPTAKSGTPGPSDSTTPETSQPSTTGKVLNGPPRRHLVSTGFTLTACTRTRTSPAAGSGMGRSAGTSTSGPPYSWITIALMGSSRLARE